MKGALCCGVMRCCLQPQLNKLIVHQPCAHARGRCTNVKYPDYRLKWQCPILKGCLLPRNYVKQVGEEETWCLRDPHALVGRRGGEGERKGRYRVDGRVAAKYVLVYCSVHKVAEKAFYKNRLCTYMLPVKHPWSLLIHSWPTDGWCQSNLRSVRVIGLQRGEVASTLQGNIKKKTNRLPSHPLLWPHTHMFLHCGNGNAMPEINTPGLGVKYV